MDKTSVGWIMIEQITFIEWMEEILHQLMNGFIMFYPMIRRVSTIQAGAGFLPSTVSSLSVEFNLHHNIGNIYTYGVMIGQSRAECTMLQFTGYSHTVFAPFWHYLALLDTTQANAQYLRMFLLATTFTCSMCTRIQKWYTFLCQYRYHCIHGICQQMCLTVFRNHFNLCNSWTKIAQNCQPLWCTSSHFDAALSGPNRAPLHPCRLMCCNIHL